mgnify:CR=1 FL=1
MEPTDPARRLLLALRSLVRWWGKGQQEQQLPLLLQLLLFGHPAPDVEGVVECFEISSDGEDESLNRQLMQGEEEVIVTRELQPREQGKEEVFLQGRCSLGSSGSCAAVGGGAESTAGCGGSNGSGLGRASVKRERL